MEITYILSELLIVKKNVRNILKLVKLYINVFKSIKKSYCCFIFINAHLFLLTIFLIYSLNIIIRNFYFTYNI